jgi:DNA-binding NtrC family response regulator
MPLEMQVKLLRALQERTVRPVGSNVEVPFDARLVTATNRDLEEEVAQKRFREDLFYRINVVRISIPPLRERSSDVLELAHYFLRRHAERSGRAPLGISPEAAKKLVAYGWPGNVRELENCVERAVALARFDHVTIEDLPEKIAAYVPGHFAVVADDVDEILSLEEVDRRYVARAVSPAPSPRSKLTSTVCSSRGRRVTTHDRHVLAPRVRRSCGRETGSWAVTRSSRAALILLRGPPRPRASPEPRLDVRDAECMGDAASVAEVKS